jgi:pimeloyl-ACP methyl ester carboxylesterase
MAMYVGRLVLCLVACLVWSGAPAAAQSRTDAPVQPPADVKPMSPTLEDVPYPHPVKFLPLTLYTHDVRMAYMDVPPAGPSNGRTVVLLHGMNFFGEYWAGTIDVLRKAGFRVVVPDQVGFGRSTKQIMPYTLSDMAANTRKLLETLGIQKAAIVGHSMGGMVATRFGLLYPDVAERLVLYNQIGLNDARLSRPPGSVDAAYKNLLNQTYDSIYRGLARYFPSGMKPEYERYVKIQYGWSLSGNWPHAAMVRALAQAMVYEDPVVYDWQHIKVRTLQLGGEKDSGPEFAPRAKYICDTIPNCELALIPGIGHVPHFEAPELFYKELLKFLKSDSQVTPQ